MKMIERPAINVIIFTIITCGIYGIYYTIVVQDDFNKYVDDGYKTSGLAVVLLGIVTFGIYNIYWIFKTSKRMDNVTGNLLANKIMITFFIYFCTYAILYSNYLMVFLNGTDEDVLAFSQNPIVGFGYIVVLIVSITYMYMFYNHIFVGAQTVNRMLDAKNVQYNNDDIENSDISQE